MIIHNEFEQLSPEWFAAKSGMPSASNAAKILTSTGKPSRQADAYMNQLLAERAGFGDPPMEPTEWMLRGIELEPEARALYEFESGREVQTVAWITNDEGTAGCSPDGLTTNGGLEVKCPKASTHIGYLRAGKLPSTYKPQVHWSLAITNLERWVWMSYYPGLDPLIITVYPDEYTEQMGKAIKMFTDILEIETGRLNLKERAA